MIMIDSILIALQQPFFLRSLIVVILLALVFPLYGNLVVLRQEANIAHTFAHLGLFGVAVGLWFDRPIQRTILGSVLVTVVLLYFLGSQEGSNQVAHNEIGAQLGLVGAILLVSNMRGYKADITSYLFGDILLLGKQDVFTIAVICVVALLLYVYFGKKWYGLSIHPSLAISKHIPVRYGYIIYLIALGLLIGGAMKVIGVLLVSAFLILPSNMGKSIASNSMQRNIVSIGLGVLVSVVALFLSWHLDMPSGASIVACMLLLYVLIKIIYRK